MKDQPKELDNGGRRAGFDRRSFIYAAYLPERRSGKDRRVQTDRRVYPDAAFFRDNMDDRRKPTSDIHVAMTG